MKNRKPNLEIDDIIFKIDTDRELKIPTIINRIWNSKKLILKAFFIAVILGVLISLTLTKEFLSTSILFPEYNEDSPSSLLGRFGGLAGFAGIDIDANSSLNPELYPTITRSTPFYLELIDLKIYHRETRDSISVDEYFNQYAPKSIWKYIGQFTIGLPQRLRKLIRTEEDNTPYVTSDIIAMDEKTEFLVKLLSNRVNCEVGKRTGLITISVEMPDPLIAADINQFTKSYIEEYLTDYKLSKYKDNLDFLISRKEEAKQDFELVQQKLSTFRDKNLNINTARASVMEEQLNAEYQLAFGVYDEISKQVEQAKIKVKEQTPVFKVLQPPIIPNNRNSPRRILLVGVFGILGVLVGIGYVIVIDWINKIKKAGAEEGQTKETLP